MCRWLAYSGEPLQPSLVILDAQHSLVAQSLDSPLGAETVNGDGFGFGWYPVGSTAGSHPSTFHSVEPAWNDENLREITDAIESPLFLSHVRAAAGPPIQRTNCHPFRHHNWLFMHNGVIHGFHAMKRDLTFAVDPSLYPDIQGTTDSEVLFHLALTFGLLDDPIAGMTRAVRFVEQTGREHGIGYPMQGTIALADGATIWAFRYSSEGRSRTLFHSVDIPTLQEMYPDVPRLKLFGENARVVVSEPLNDLPGAFVEVPESVVAILGPEGYHYEPFMAGAGVR
ncbi:class II glutamine amidotransferase [Agromyces badenianii]|uniref:class II glutamine amidotransferase n=1 Tax=Agromyces badenianii TaxID=2080742 RepID=UPI000D5950CA|nr:class II glutamine amidotransferase [Agromyces badenianii]